MQIFYYYCNLSYYFQIQLRIAASSIFVKITNEVQYIFKISSVNVINIISA